MGLRRLVHADADVGHFQEDVTPGPSGRVRPNEVLAERNRLDRSTKLATRWHRIAGVGGGIEKDLVDLDPVRENTENLGLDVEPDDDVLADEATDKPYRLARDCSQI
jgi:hypothetical protein